MKSLFDYSGKVSAGDIEALVSQGADVNHANSKGITSFMMAACYGYLSAADALLANGANINARDNEGNTALILACHGGQPNVVHYLLARGADANIPDAEGKDCYQVLGSNGFLTETIVAEIVGLLESSGAKKSHHGSIPYITGISIPSMSV